MLVFEGSTGVSVGYICSQDAREVKIGPLFQSYAMASSMEYQLHHSNCR